MRYLNRTEIASGFANRILWTCVKRSKYLPEGGLADERALAKLDARLEKALRFAGQADEGRRDRGLGISARLDVGHFRSLRASFVARTLQTSIDRYAPPRDALRRLTGIGPYGR